MATQSEKERTDYLKTRRAYLQDRVRQTQDALRQSGLSSERKKALQDKLKNFKDNLLKIKSNSSLKETDMTKSLKQQYRESLSELTQNKKVGAPANKAPAKKATPAKPAAKKATPAKTSKASKDADIKAITNLEDKFNNNLKASGPRDPKVKALQKELIERKEKFNDTYKSAKPFYYLAEPVKAGSTPLDKLKSLYLEIENTRNDKTRERLAKQADSIEKKLSPADAKKAKQFLADSDKSRRDELNKKISSKPSAKKAGDTDANGKRYTKRGVTQMLKQLREQQESGRKTSNAYKQREEDIKRLTKVLKTLSSANPKIALADQHRISVIANSLEVVTANTVWGTGATYDELAKALKKLGIKGVTADGLESDFDEGDGVTSGSEPVYKYFDKVLGEDESGELAGADGAFVFATLYIAGLLGGDELKTLVPNANIRKMILSCN